MIRLGKRRKPDDPGDSGSLNDLSFLLIIFFLVIAGFNVNKGFLLNLPDSSRPRLVQTEDLMKCRLAPDGAIMLDGKATTLEELSLSVRNRKTAWPNMTFLLTIDPACPWQKVVDIIHEIRVLRVENFSFRMEEVSR